MPVRALFRGAPKAAAPAPRRGALPASEVLCEIKTPPRTWVAANCKASCGEYCAKHACKNAYQVKYCTPTPSCDLLTVPKQCDDLHTKRDQL